jgi:hypothetical protein
MYSSKYVESKAILIYISASKTIQKYIDTLADVLSKEPYNFEIILLSYDKDCDELFETFEDLKAMHIDSRLFIYVAGQLFVDVNNIAYYSCSNENSKINRLIPCSKFFELPAQLPTKHIAIAFDNTIAWEIIGRFTEVIVFAPNINIDPMLESAYQFFMLAPNATRTLAETLIDILNKRPFAPFTVTKLVYEADEIYPHFYLYIEGSQGGDFTF